MCGQSGERARDRLGITHRPEETFDPRSGDRGEEGAQVQTDEDPLTHMCAGVGEDAPAANESVRGRVHGNPAQDLLEQPSERLPEERCGRFEQPGHGIRPADPGVPVEVVRAGRCASLETLYIGDPRRLLHRDLQEFRQRWGGHRPSAPASGVHPSGRER